MATATLKNDITFALDVSDRQASADWYVTHLGFSVRFDADEMGWTELATHTDGVTLGLGDNDKPQPGNAIPVFGVVDIERERAALENAGVRFDGPTTTYDGMVKIATFYDPDNNALMLAQDLSE
ncbi:MAG: VOC family protein [Pseudomonadota bacterium]